MAPPAACCWRFCHRRLSQSGLPRWPRLRWWRPPPRWRRRRGEASCIPAHTAPSARTATRRSSAGASSHQLPAVPARAARRAARTARHTLRTCRRARRRRTRAPRPLSGARLPSAQVGAHDDGHARDARVEAPRRRRRQLRDARRHAPRRPPAAVRGARRRGARLEPADVHSRPGLAPRRRRGRRRLPRQRARADRRARGGGRRQLQGVRRPRRAAEPVLTLDRLCPLPRPPHHFPPAPPPAPPPPPPPPPRFGKPLAPLAAHARPPPSIDSAAMFSSCALTALVLLVGAAITMVNGKVGAAPRLPPPPPAPPTLPAPPTPPSPPPPPSPAPPPLPSRAHDGHSPPASRAPDAGGIELPPPARPLLAPRCRPRSRGRAREAGDRAGGISRNGSAVLSGGLPCCQVRRSPSVRHRKGDLVHAVLQQRGILPDGDLVG